MASTDTRRLQSSMHEALNIADGITPSVVSLAKVAKVTPKAFAEAIADSMEISEYRSEVAQNLQKILVKQAIEEAKKKEESENDK